jgi:chromate transport protein ChrA
MNIAAAAALAFIGPGRISLDHALGWDLHGIGWGLIAIGLGVVAASIVLVWRRAQLARPATEEGRHVPPRAA